MFAPPAIQGLGVSGGFQMQLEDRGERRPGRAPAGHRRDGPRRQRPDRPEALNSTFRSGVPAALRRRRPGQGQEPGRPAGLVFSTLQASLGSAYVNDFNKFGRTYQVRVQADQKFRLEPEDIRRLEVRNRAGR